MSKELTLYKDGSVILTDEDGHTIWTSDGDDDYLQEFDAQADPDDIDDILEYLADTGYIEDDEDVDVFDQSEEDDDEAATGEHRTLNG